MDAPVAARVGSCGSSLRAARAAGAARDRVCGCCVRRRLQEQLQPVAMGSAELGFCVNSLRWRLQAELQPLDEGASRSSQLLRKLEMVAAGAACAQQGRLQEQREMEAADAA